MVAFTYRMPAGIPGAITRESQATIEPQLFDSAAPFGAYGLPVKISAGGKAQPVGSGDAATAVYGFLVRPYPTASSQDGVGTSTPPTSGPCDVLRRGYMAVKLNSGTAAKNGQVYIRVANASGGKPIGGVEAAADSTNTIAPAGVVFTGAADAGGVVEIAFNI